MSLLIENLNVVYREGSHSIQALENISIDLKKGECSVLIGESGSGKTTLGMACMRLLPPTAEITGNIFLDDMNIPDVPEKEMESGRWERISMSFQQGGNNFNPVYTILQQVSEPLNHHRGYSIKDAEKTAAEVLCSWGIGEKLHSRYPHQLSGGQQQLAMLSMSVILDPEVVILDEPTSSLDLMSRAMVIKKINELRENGKSILLITHDLDLAHAAGDTAYILYLGQVMEILPAGEIIKNPVHPYTKALSRSFPVMNETRDLGGIKGDAFYRKIHQHGHHDSGDYEHSHIETPDFDHKNTHPPHPGCIFRNRCTQSVSACAKGSVDLTGDDGRFLRCVRGGIVDLLNMRGVSKKYGKTRALCPADFILKSGELFSLVGETGSGKTTLAMTAAGILTPDSGKRELMGRDMDSWIKQDYTSFSKKIGIVYQNLSSAVNPRFTVYDAVSEPLVIHGADMRDKETAKKVTDMLSRVHLSSHPEFLNSRTGDLNMGAIQRVCIARALVLEPEFLIADEPTNSLDPSVQAKIMRLLLELQIEEGLTMLFVTHNMGLARKISDRIGVMLSGNIVESGPASDVISNPVHPYTKDLIQGPEHIHLSTDRYETEGCPYSDRCTRAGEICRTQKPLFRNTELRQVACHYPLKT